MKDLIGVAWFTPEEWAKLRAVAPDADQLQATFAEWQATLEKSLAELRANGVRLQRVPISVSALVAWCDARGRRPDFDARAEYTASEFLRIYEASLPPSDD